MHSLAHRDGRAVCVCLPVCCVSVSAWGGRPWLFGPSTNHSFFSFSSSSPPNTQPKHHPLPPRPSSHLSIPLHFFILLLHFFISLFFWLITLTFAIPCRCETLALFSSQSFHCSLQSISFSRIFIFLLFIYPLPSLFRFFPFLLSVGSESSHPHSPHLGCPILPTHPSTPILSFLILSFCAHFPLLGHYIYLRRALNNVPYI